MLAMTPQEAITTTNSVLTGLWRRYQDPEWKLDDSNRACLRLETGLHVLLQLSDAASSLVVTVPVATLELAESGKPGSAPDLRSLLDEIKGEFKSLGNFDLRQLDQDIVCTTELSIATLNSNRLEAVLVTHVAVAEAIAAALQAELQTEAGNT